MSLELLNVQHVEQRLLFWNQTSIDFAALMARYGDPAPALRHFGLIQWQALNLDVAVEAFVAALSLTPDDACLWSDLAAVYDGLSRVELAKICIQGAIERDPRRATYWLKLASLVDREGDREAAEMGYRQAIALDPALADAHFGLGILCFAQLRLEESLSSLRAAIEHGHTNAFGHTCLGHVLYLTGDFAGCAAAFETAGRLGPLDVNSQRKHARALTFQSMIEGPIETALALYPARAGEAREDIANILRDAFSLLSAYGHQGQAVEIGKIRLAHDPSDPIQSYLLDAVSGRSLTRAPTDYIERFFDRFAAEFDHKLVETLRYKAPQLMCSQIGRHASSFDAILDLGCGTGLAASHLAAFGGTLTGVDLSAGMLAEAAKRARYRDLVKADAAAFVEANPGRFDLVFAADMVIYLGDLAPLMAAVSRALIPGGYFALSIETSLSHDFVLLPSGRFAHSPGYVERLARADFEVLEYSPTMLRLEANRPVDGALIVLRRRTGESDTFAGVEAAPMFES